MKHSALLIAVLLCTPAMAADDPVLNLLADYVTYCIPGAAIPSADRPLVIAAIQEAVGEKDLEQAGRKMLKEAIVNKDEICSKIHTLTMDGKRRRWHAQHPGEQ
jgi:hypothetical protein